jgi:hypothetical protein
VLSLIGGDGPPVIVAHLKGFVAALPVEPKEPMRRDLQRSRDHQRPEAPDPGDSAVFDELCLTRIQPLALKEQDLGAYEVRAAAEVEYHADVSNLPPIPVHAAAKEMNVDVDNHSRRDDVGAEGGCDDVDKRKV